MPEGTPNLASPTDHSWTLQAVMDLHKSVGSLTAQVGRLSEDINGLSAQITHQTTKIEQVKHWQTLVTGGAVVVAAIAGIAWTILTFVPWDRIHFDPPKTEQVPVDAKKQ